MWIHMMQQALATDRAVIKVRGPEKEVSEFHHRFPSGWKADLRETEEGMESSVDQANPKLANWEFI